MDVSKIIFHLLLLYVCHIKSEHELEIKETCSIDDNDCINRLVNDILLQITEKKIDGLMSVDPLFVTNVTFTFLNSIHLTVEHGLVENLRSCRYERSSINLNKMEMEVMWVCDVVMEGNFTLRGSNPILQTFLNSDSVTGNGYVKIALDQLSLDLSFPFILVKKEDNNIYANTAEHEPKIVYDLKNAIIETRDVVIGNQDFSALINAYFNANWELILKNVGKQFFGTIAEIYMSILHNIFMKISVNSILKEDLSSYVS